MPSPSYIYYKPIFTSLNWDPVLKVTARARNSDRTPEGTIVALVECRHGYMPAAKALGSSCLKHPDTHIHAWYQAQDHPSSTENISAEPGLAWTYIGVKTSSAHSLDSTAFISVVGCGILIEAMHAGGWGTEGAATIVTPHDFGRLYRPWPSFFYETDEFHSRSTVAPPNLL